MHTGTTDTGDLDIWTFNANSGDALVVRVGKITDTSGNYTPWVRLYSPLGKLLGSGFGASAAEGTGTKPNTGTFIAGGGGGQPPLSGTGTHPLTLAQNRDPGGAFPRAEGGWVTG